MEATLAPRATAPLAASVVGGRLKVGNSYRMSVRAGGQGELSCLGRVRRLGELGAGLETDQLLPVG